MSVIQSTECQPSSRVPVRSYRQDVKQHKLIGIVCSKLLTFKSLSVPGQPDSSTHQVRTFRGLFLITELLDSKAGSDDVGFEAELARMSSQIERAFRLVEVLKKAAADPSNRSSIDPPLFRLSRSGSKS
jgi:hypothetical protein